MIPIQNGLICWLDATTGKNENTIWKDLSGSYNDFILQGFTFDGTNGWTETSIKKTKTNFIHTKNKIKNFRSIIIKVKITDWTNPSYLIDLRPDASAWIYSTSRDGIGDKINTQKIYKNGVISQLDLTNMLSDDFVYYYLELTSNITCPVFLGSRHTLNEGSGLEIQSVFIYNRTLSEQEINNMCKQINNQYVNENNLPTIVDKLMDASNIKIANNKYGNRVQTVIDGIVEKADNVTKAINQEVINTDYSFKVGTGTNVDVSSDVQDGFSSIAIKGNTYQNLFNNSTRVMNGTYDSISQEFVSTEDEWFTIGGTDMLKPNTTYTLLFLYKSTANQINIRIDNDTAITNGTTIIKDFGDISSTNNFQQFKKTFTTFEKVAVSRLLIRKCYGGTVTIKYPVLLEGDYTNDILPDYFEEIIGVGNKSKNLFNGKIIDGGWYNAHTGVFEKSQDNYLTQPIQVKQNTSYINNLSFNYCWLFDSSHNFIKYKGGGNVVNSESASYIVFGKSFSKVSKPFDVSKLQIEEGTVATPYESYYEGYKIEILSRGKNLYKPNLQTKSAGGLAFSLHDNTLIVNGTATDTVDFRPVNEAKDIITLELYNYVNKLPVGTTLRLSNNLGLRNFFGISRNGAQTYIANTLTIQEGDYCITCFVRFEKGQSYNNAKLKIQLEINNVATEYAPYVEDKTQILLDEPLMKLPNGVCDEITKDGKLIRRIGKIILDGTERDLALNDTSSNHTQFVIHNIIKTAQKNNHANLVCNTKPTLVKNEGNNSIWIYIGKTVVFQMQSGMTVDAFRQWLSQNPTTVYYELETPVITDIVPPSVRIFKDGHLTFNTLVTPESTHLVQLNKSAQINNTLEQIQSLNKKVDALDIIYNSLISSTSNTLSNLNK